MTAAGEGAAAFSPCVLCQLKYCVPPPFLALLLREIETDVWLEVNNAAPTNKFPHLAKFPHLEA